MTSGAELVVATAVLGAGTFGFRFAGPALRSRIALPARAERLLAVAVVVLLASLVATSALTDGHHLTGPARPAGVAVGALCAWRRAPFLVVVLAAGAATAVLRLLGLS